MAKLTVKKLESLTAADAGQRLRDGENLIGLVKPRAEDGVSVLFRWRYRFGGEVKDYGCGTWPRNSLADIRAERDKAQAILDTDKDPAEGRRIARLEARATQAEAIGAAQARIDAANAAKARLTVAELFERWAATELKKRKDGGAEVRRSFTKDVMPAIGTVAVEDVKRAMVAALLDAVVQRGARIIARELLGDMRMMFNFAIKRELLEHNPTDLLRRDDFGKKVERERVLKDEEIKLLPGLLVDARMSEASAAAIWIMLSTCCRVGEITRAKWKDVDLDDAKQWRIPPENSKNAKEHVIALSPFALGHFEALKELAGKRAWVLPASRTDGHVDVKSLSKTIGDRQRGDDKPMAHRAAQTDALALPGGRWTAHDLRRTGATMMVRLGVRPDVVEKALNHQQVNKLIRTYQREELKAEQAEAWRKLGERLELLLRKDADNVVVMRVA